MIAVMGATGNTGRKIARALLDAGERVRTLGRSAARLADLERAGAEAWTGDAADAAFLAQAFRGADAVYTLLPTDRRSPDYASRQAAEGEAIVTAIRTSGVRFVVALSSLGGDIGDGMGLIAGLNAQEERLAGLARTNVLLLRPVSFFENFYEALPLIRDEGIVADSVAADLAIPMVATRDVADVAADALRSRDWEGLAARELLGPRDLSYGEATGIIGARLGRPDLSYVRLSCDEMAGVLVQAGLSASFAGLYVEMTRAFNEGRVKPRCGRTPQNTTPTRFEDFAGELVESLATAPLTDPSSRYRL